jgi:tetratricopeptide (TPR) repeat protein
MRDRRDPSPNARCRVGVALAALLAMFAAFAVLPEHAQAQEDPYSTLLDAAFDEYEAHRYQAALELFEKAAEVRRTGEVLFNIAACHEYLGNLEEAVAALKESVQLGISASLQERAQRKIETLEQRIEPDASTPDTTPVEQPVEVEGEATAAPIDKEWRQKRRTLQGLGAGLLGGGAAGVAAGGVLWGLAWRENGLVGAAEDLETKQGHIDATGQYALAGDITAGIGAAVAVSGLVVSLVGCRCAAPGNRGTQVALHPAVLPLPDGGFALVVGGEF